MTDKTCGTCAIGDNTTVWCGELGRRMPSWHEACGEYEDRSDSVEQVAVEILGSLVIRCGSECGSWCVMWHDGACSAKFADRLRALGVTP